MIQLILNNVEINTQWINFSDGASTCRVNPDDLLRAYKINTSGTLHINVLPTTPVDRVSLELEMIDSACYHVFNSLEFKEQELGAIDWFDLNKNLHLHYLPYGRADRIFQNGNPNLLFDFLNGTFVNSCNMITVYDPHNVEILKSTVGTKRLDIKNQLDCFLWSTRTYKGQMKEWTHVIAPDKGAVEKAKSIADYLGISCVCATKERDLDTGRIVNTTLDTELPAGSHVIICDDIGDYCGTHIALGEILREQGCTIDLYVTHLIAPKGLSKLRGVFDKVYTFQTVGGYINKTDVMEFNNGKMY